MAFFREPKTGGKTGGTVLMAFFREPAGGDSHSVPRFPHVTLFTRQSIPSQCEAEMPDFGYSL
jgi:hypothetical protein